MSRKKLIDNLVALQKTRTFGIDTWIPSHQRLLGSPSLLPGEALSSWCWRISGHLKIPFLSVAKTFGISISIHLADVGCILLDLEKISISVSKPPETLIGLLWPETFADNWDIVSCLTTVPLEGRPLYRYCENCFSEDVEPYIRQVWRFSFAYVCPVHGSTLRDHCFHCKKPFFWNPNQKKFRVASLRYCVHCGGDLCDVSSSFFPLKLRFHVLARQLDMVKMVCENSPIVEDALGGKNRGYFEFVRNGVVIDLTSEKNVMRLYMDVLAALSLQDQAAEWPDLHTRFAPYLFKTRVKFDVESDLCLGLDGWSVFGSEAAVLPSYLQLGGCTWSGTYWSMLEPTQGNGGVPSDELHAAWLWMERLKTAKPT